MPRAGSAARDALPALVERYGPRVHALARRLCPTEADAQDMVQDVFLRAFRAWHTFRGDADPGTWLYAIAARACGARRGGPGRRVPPLSSLMPWRETTVMEIAAAPTGEGSAAERAEAVARVRREIMRLPEHLRLPLLLKEVLEMSISQTGAALGLTQNTVKTRVHRARLALRKAMMSASRGVEAPSPIYERQVCLDLLKAKLDAMDRGGADAREALPRAEVCARCRAVFRELDLVQDACAQLGEAKVPAELRARILGAIRRHDEQLGSATVRRGRRPVAASARRGVSPPVSVAVRRRRPRNA